MDISRQRLTYALFCISIAIGLGLYPHVRTVAADRGRPVATGIPRMSDGRPDLEGIWNNSTQTPLERPVALGTKQFYSDEELARLRLREHDENNRQGDTGTYNQFWWEEGGFLKQTSLIIDPPSGRIPARTPEGARRRAAWEARMRALPESWEDRNLAERCLSRGAPKLPGGYNNNFLIVQTPQYISILQEMIHEARIIPLDGRPHPPSSVRSYLGDSRGRWDGDTLIVETTHFNGNVGQTSYNCCGGAAEHLTIEERFSLTDRNAIDYRYTVTDPSMFERPWTVSVPMRRDPGPIFEYACHEANYSLVGILKGARADEAKASKKTP